METVFTAMSGGIDSAYAAHLLKVRGYKVIGVTFQLLPAYITDPISPKACCSTEATARARRFADIIGIPHYVIDLRKEFEENVIERFIDEYKSGRTPNPCVFCNRFIKFSSFLHRAMSAGADKIGTGHYAIVEEGSHGFMLKKGVDATKDQSYFLYSIKREDLAFILLPVGHHTKDEVAKEDGIFDFYIKHVRESQDLCFIRENDYRGFLSKFVEIKEGPIFHIDGSYLGRHDSIHFFTVGQRKGLRIPYREPLYVLEIIPGDNSVIVGPRECLKKDSLVASDINILCDSIGPAAGKVRYRQKEEPCTYTMAEDMLEVVFDNPIYSITPGQSIVLYENDAVIGGGIIQTC